MKYTPKYCRYCGKLLTEGCSCEYEAIAYYVNLENEIEEAPRELEEKLTIGEIETIRFMAEADHKIYDSDILYYINYREFDWLEEHDYIEENDPQKPDYYLLTSKGWNYYHDYIGK